jgi:hypothetical protein
MATLALGPVAVAVFGLLNVSAVTALATGGVVDQVAQGTPFPFVLVDVQERDVRGFGTGGLPEVAIRVHVFSTYEGGKEAQAILAACIAQLKDVALTVAGYRMCGLVFYDDTIALPDQAINGVPCRELVANFRAYVEQV